MSIMVIGSANTDLIIQVKQIPKPGETILGSNFITASGGKGANQAVSAARLSGNVKFIASIGQDTFGDMLIGNYLKDKIDIKYIKRKNEASGTAMIMVAQNGQNSIAVAPGANALLSIEDLNLLEHEFDSSKIVLAQLETPIDTVIHASKLTKKYNNLFILNPAPALNLPDVFYPLIDIITPNETEAKILTGIDVYNKSSALSAAKVLHEKGVKNVIITLGCQGAFFYDGNHSELVPTINVKAVDTTAAGDTFNGALAKYLDEDSGGLVNAIRYANKAAAISVTKLGAQPSIPYAKDMEAVIR
jgi:ribokinase